MMDKYLHSLENVFYPPVGIAHITDNIADLFRDRIANKKSITIRSSAQPNSSPHLGTITTIMSCFALGELLQRELGLRVNIVFDVLENSPGTKKIINDIEYQLSLRNTPDEYGNIYFEKYLVQFRYIFNFLSKITGIEFKLREYEEFQLNPIIRNGLKRIFMMEDKIKPLVSPSNNRLRIRFQCPVCKLVDKAAQSVKIISTDADHIIFESTCPYHGSYTVSLYDNNSDFIDANTPLRDILQGVLSIEEDMVKQQFSIMLDGGDWGGTWSLRVFCEGLLALGYDHIPTRLFTPVICDWSGAKFSKSLYVHSKAYKYLPDAFTNFSSFLAQYGESGMTVIWNEVKDWVSSPKKFFRNYSVEYLKLILSNNLIN